MSRGSRNALDQGTCLRQQSNLCHCSPWTWESTLSRVTLSRFWLCHSSHAGLSTMSRSTKMIPWKKWAVDSCAEVHKQCQHGILFCLAVIVLPTTCPQYLSPSSWFKSYAARFSWIFCRSLIITCALPYSATTVYGNHLVETVEAQVGLRQFLTFLQKQS